MEIRDPNRASFFRRFQSFGRIGACTQRSRTRLMYEGGRCGACRLSRLEPRNTGASQADLDRLAYHRCLLEPVGTAPPAKVDATTTSRGSGQDELKQLQGSLVRVTRQI